MKHLFRLVVRLYPSWWRQRYAREFEALLEDVNPGWAELFDVIHGALTMQLKTPGTIPVACALAGAIAGGILAMRTPAVFASSATLRLKAPGIAGADSATTQELRVSLDKALAASKGTPAATLVTLHKGDSAQTILTLTYMDRDPAQARRYAEILAGAIAADYRERAASTEVLAVPGLPTSPIRPDYSTTVASGGGVGLVAGGVIFLLLRSRRRPASAA